jgi:hypothetical protein
MDFHLKFAFPSADFKIQHGDRISLLGSCFSDSMQSHFSRSGFDVLSNPFGTIFHPAALANSIEFSLNQSKVPRIFQRGELYFCWDSASVIYGNSETEVRSKLDVQRAVFADYLQSAKCLLVTFGTAWGYELIDENSSLPKDQLVVANCHKMPATHFEKKLMSVANEWSRWQTLILALNAVNPELKIIFTVSPVRHKKDGLIENNQSKARLIELVHRLVESTSAYYFPAYEIVIDELRDYRFFKEDRVHPTDEAVRYVWNRFEETYFSAATQNLAQKVRNLHKLIDHHTLHPASEETRRYVESTKEKLGAVLTEFPDVWWDR